MSNNPSIVLKKVNEIVIEDRPIPHITDPHFVKVAIRKTGICGSDVHYYSTGSCGSFKVKKPIVLGHESSGEIVEVGSEVKTLKPGDRVACEPGVPSRYSYAYKSGNYNMCPDMEFAATPPVDPSSKSNGDGTLCRYFLLPEDNCYKVSDKISLDEAAVVEPLSVAVHTIRASGLKFGDRLAVFGAGPIGLLVASVGKAYGATDILMVDINDERLRFAGDILQVTTQVYNSGRDVSLSLDERRERHLEAFGGQPATVSIDATGNALCIGSAINLLGLKGSYVQVGMGGETLNGFPMAAVCERELTVKGSFRYGVDDYSLAVKLLETGKVDVKPLITHHFKFEQAVEAYELVKAGKAIKAIIDGPTD